MQKIINQDLLSQLYFSQNGQKKQEQEQESKKVKEKRANSFIGTKGSGTSMYLMDWRRKNPNPYRDGHIYIYNVY